MYMSAQLRFHLNAGTVWWVRNELISHRANAGIFDIHPKRVRHHFVVTCMVVRYNAERWHHFFGNRDDH